MGVGGFGEHGRRDRLVNDLWERIRAHGQTGDPGPVLDATVPSMARDLAHVLNSSARRGASPDVEAMGVLVTLHWYRYEVLPLGQDQADLQACLAWSTRLVPVAPQLVPDPIRAHLSGAEAAHESHAAGKATTRAIAPDDGV